VPGHELRKLNLVATTIVHASDNGRRKIRRRRQNFTTARVDALAVSLHIPACERNCGLILLEQGLLVRLDLHGFSLQSAQDYRLTSILCRASMGDFYKSSPKSALAEVG
jgi:hypothetical protein